LSGELWKLSQIDTTDGALLVAFDSGIPWLEERVGRPLSELGAVQLNAEKDGLMSTKSPATLSWKGNAGMLELSNDMRVAFCQEATVIDTGAEPDPDDDEWY